MNRPAEPPRGQRKGRRRAEHEHVVDPERVVHYRRRPRGRLMPLLGGGVEPGFASGDRGRHGGRHHQGEDAQRPLHGCCRITACSPPCQEVRRGVVDAAQRTGRGGASRLRGRPRRSPCRCRPDAGASGVHLGRQLEAFPRSRATVGDRAVHADQDGRQAWPDGRYRRARPRCPPPRASRPGRSAGPGRRPGRRASRRCRSSHARRRSPRSRAGAGAVHWQPAGTSASTDRRRAAQRCCCVPPTSDDRVGEPGGRTGPATAGRSARR